MPLQELLGEINELNRLTAALDKAAASYSDLANKRSRGWKVGGEAQQLQREMEMLKRDIARYSQMTSPSATATQWTQQFRQGVGQYRMSTYVPASQQGLPPAQQVAYVRAELDRQWRTSLNALTGGTTYRAPQGGVNIGGKQYRSGQIVPTSYASQNAPSPDIFETGVTAEAWKAKASRVSGGAGRLDTDVMAIRSRYERALREFENVAKYGPELKKMGFSDAELQNLQMIARVSKNASTGITEVKGALHDGATVTKEASAAFAENGRQLETNGKAIRTFADNMKHNVTKVLEWTIATSALYAAFGIVARGAQSVTELDTKLADLSFTLGSSAEAMTRFSEASKTAATYGVPLAESLDVMSKASRFTKDQGEQLTLTNNASKLAAIGNMSLTRTNEALTNSVRQLDVPISQTGELIDKWAQGSRVASVSVEDLTEGFSRAGLTLRQAGLNIDQTTAFLATLGEVSDKTGTELGNAASSLAQFYTRPETQKELSSVGINVYADRARTQFRPLMDIIDELSKKRRENTITEIEYNRVVSSLGGGTRYGREMRSFVDQYARYQEILAGVQKSQGAADEKLALSQETLTFKLNRVSVAFDSLAQSIARGGLLDSFKSLISLGEGLVTVMDNLAKATTSGAISSGNVLTSVGLGLLAARINPLLGVGVGLTAMAYQAGEEPEAKRQSAAQLVRLRQLQNMENKTPAQVSELVRLRSGTAPNVDLQENYFKKLEQQILMGGSTQQAAEQAILSWIDSVFPRDMQGNLTPVAEKARGQALEDINVARQKLLTQLANASEEELLTREDISDEWKEFALRQKDQARAAYLAGITPETPSYGTLQVPTLPQRINLPQGQRGAMLNIGAIGAAATEEYVNSMARAMMTSSDRELEALDPGAYNTLLQENSKKIYSEYAGQLEPKVQTFVDQMGNLYTATVSEVGKDAFLQGLQDFKIPQIMQFDDEKYNLASIVDRARQLDIEYLTLTNQDLNTYAKEATAIYQQNQQAWELVTGVSQQGLSLAMQGFKSLKPPDIIDESKASPEMIQRAIQIALEQQAIISGQYPDMAKHFDEQRLVILAKNNELLFQQGVDSELLRIILGELVKTEKDVLRGSYNLPGGYTPPTPYQYYRAGGTTKGPVNYPTENPDEATLKRALTLWGLKAATESKAGLSSVGAQSIVDAMGGKITSNYGPRSLFEGEGFHPAVDFGGVPGQEVRSPVAGTLTRYIEDSMSGRQAVVTLPDGTELRFGHLSAESIGKYQAGASINRGDILGWMGDPANKTSQERTLGAHTEIMALRNGQYVDPNSISTSGTTALVTATNATTSAVTATSAQNMGELTSIATNTSKMVDAVNGLRMDMVSILNASYTQLIKIHAAIQNRPLSSAEATQAKDLMARTTITGYNPI